MTSPPTPDVSSLPSAQVSRRHRRFGTGSVVAAVSTMTALLLTVAGLRFEAASGTAFDQGVLAWMVEHRQPTLTIFARTATTAGGPAGVAVAMVVFCALLWRRTGTLLAPISTAASVVFTGIGVSLLKVIVAEQRPPKAVQILGESGYSFPSGHVAGTLTLAGVVAVLAGAGARTMIKLALAVAAAAIVSVIAFTRLYLGVHWMSDVVGGALLGGISVTLAYSAFRQIHNRRGRCAAQATRCVR